MASLRALITAALAAAAAALPGSTPTPTSTRAPAIPSDASGFSWTPAPSDQSTCGPPSFHAADADAHAGPMMPPADWRHCAALFSSWAGRNGTFAVHDGRGGAGTNATQLIPLLAGRGCVLGVRAGDDDDDGDKNESKNGGWITIGDRDVKGIMRTALEDWSRGTELEVRGEVRCAAAEGGTGGLRWQIYGDQA